jgi:hypothetical protein
MADTATSALVALTGANVSPLDLFPIVDVSDTTQGAGGSLKKITREELQTYNAGTLTTDKKVLDISATWNNAAVTFTADKINITDTASGANSLLFDRQVGGVSQCSITKAGLLTTKTLMVSGSGDSFSCSGNITAVGHLVFSNGFATFESNTDTKELVLLQHNAATGPFVLQPGSGVQLEQRNGTNAQTLRLYNTYTDANNFERLAIGWSGNVVSIKPENAGTGAARVLHISGLPTSNPGPGILWNNAGTPAIGT